VHGRKQSTNASGNGRFEKPISTALIEHIKLLLATSKKEHILKSRVKSGRS
jgi:hypothetical protein